MATNPFAKATKKRAKLRFALMGTSGSGKTYTALSVATALGRTAVIDTEHGSASKYADRFEFDVLELHNFHPQQYVDAIQAAANAGYEVVVIDSLSHAWNGTGGALEIVDRVTKQSQSKNSYMAWADVTPLQNKLIEAIVGAPIHVIATLRSKTEYVLERDERGKTTPRKVGLAPVQRDGMEYEFDVVGEMDTTNTLLITKTRVPELSNAVMPQPGKELSAILRKWLEDGVEAPATPEAPQQPTSPPQQVPAPVSVSTAPAADADTLTAGLGANVTRMDAAHLPRTADDLPILGSLNMGDLLRKSYEAGWVTGKQHFSNLVDLLWREGSVRDASTPKAVLEAICQHYEAKQEAG